MEPNFLSNLTGSFAMPAMENPTVAMVEAAYRHHNLNWRYLNCEVSPENLRNAVLGAQAMGWAGFNCSIPYKVAVIEHLDDLGRSAEIIGAVNTVVRNNNRYIGENTDGRGFVKSLRKVIDPKLKNVVLFGAGGAARAVGVELALAGASHISIVNRNFATGKQLAQLIREKTPAGADFEPWTSNFPLPKKTHIVVNATSIGLYPKTDECLDFNIETLTPEMVVADGIHNPPVTPFIRTAKLRGCKVIDGLDMLVYQGEIGIHYWTGINVDTTVMRTTLDRIFSP